MFSRITTRFLCLGADVLNYRHFYLERVGDASEIPAEAWGCCVCAGQVNEARPGERGSPDIYRDTGGATVVPWRSGSGQTGIHQVCRGYGPGGTKRGVGRLGGRRAGRRGRTPGIPHLLQASLARCIRIRSSPGRHRRPAAIPCDDFPTRAAGAFGQSCSKARTLHVCPSGAPNVARVCWGGRIFQMGS